MDRDEFTRRWTRWYPGTPAIGHRLRPAWPQRWLRIHSLPESRRYATTAEEWSELLARHNEVATAVLGDGGACLMVLSQWCTAEDMPPVQVRLDKVPLARLTPVPPHPNDGDDDAGQTWLYGAPVTWKPGAHDAILRAAADDQTGSLLFAQLESGRVYAPYDGGADLFFPSEEERDAASERWAAWRSQHPAGL